MTDPWQILIIEDDVDVADTIPEMVQGATSFADEPLSVTVENSFDEALTILMRGNVDLLVLDVRDQGLIGRATTDEEADQGIRVFDEVRSRRFTPIVFYTAVPNQVESLSNPPFVQVVSKLSHDPVDELRNAVDIAFTSDLPKISRALERHVETVTREFMIDFVTPNWASFNDHKDDLAHLLLRRLSVSMEGGANTLADQLGYPANSDEGIHATRYYVAPPIEGHRMGDILRDHYASPLDIDSVDAASWYIVLTPSCDLVENRVKADHVVLAQCLPVRDNPQYKEWIKACAQDPTSKSKTKEEQKLKRLLESRPEKGQKDRFHYLPAAWEVPDLLVDLQRILHIQHDRLTEYEKVASLDNPFSEALLHRFNRYLGRVGVPTLNLDAALTRMANRAHPTDAAAWE